MEKESKIYDIRRKSDFVNDVLNKTPNWIIVWGNTFFIIFLLLILLLSWFIKYPDIVKSEAFITSEAPPIKLVSRTTGEIDSIFIKNNSKVNKGDILLIFKTTASVDHIIELEKELNFLNKNINNLDSVFNFPLKYLNVGELQESHNNFIKTIRKYKNYSFDNNYKIQSSINNSRINNLISSISKLKIQKNIAYEEMEVGKLNLDRNTKMFEKGIVTQTDLETSKNQYLQNKRQIEQIDNQIYQIQQEIGLIKSNIQSLHQTDKDTKLDYSIEVSNAIKEMTKEFESWNNTYVLKSSKEGYIQFLDNLYKNKFIKMDTDLIYIISKKEQLSKITLKMSTINSGKVKKGQLVNIKLNNYPYEEFGVIQGRIKTISEVIDQDYYFVEADLINGLNTTYKKKIEPKNLVGVGEIITEDLRLIERLFYSVLKKVK